MTALRRPRAGRSTISRKVDNLRAHELVGPVLYTSRTCYIPSSISEQLLAALTIAAVRRQSRTDRRTHDNVHSVASPARRRDSLRDIFRALCAIIHSVSARYSDDTLEHLAARMVKLNARHKSTTST